MSERRRPRGGGHGPRLGMPVEKAKDFKGTLRRLLRYLEPHRFQLIMVWVMAALGTVFGILGPRIMGQATTTLFEGLMAKRSGIPGAGIDFGRIQQILWILAGLYVVSAVCSYLQQYIMASVAQNTVFDMRQDLNNKLNRLPLSFFDSQTHGEILSRVTNDVDTVSRTLQQSLTQAITSAISLIGVVIMMLMISPPLTLVAALTLPLSILVTTKVAKRSQKHFRWQQAALGNLNGHVEEMFTGHRVIKAFGCESTSIDTFNDINQELYDAGWRAQFVSGIIMPLMGFIGNLGYVLVCVIGGIFATQGRLRIGDVQAFVQYSGQFSQPISRLASIANVIQSAIAAAERVFEILDEVEEIPDVDHGALEEIKGEVRFENVSFSYHENTPLISDLNINAQPGQVIAIVGPTGAGKTTLVNLLMRFYEIDTGRITIDGVDIRHIPRGRLRSHLGMVLQDTWLFHGTIKENIAYARPEATDEDIYRAAKMARADHFIRTLPEGYDTILNEEASNISQGQKQLLTIARAILADPAILILDEATSSVDTRTEIHIQRAMQELMKGRTSFVIAHRLSTIRDADLILVMDNGHFVEQGTHQELLAMDGFYADLYNSQFTGTHLEKAAR